MKKIAVIAGLLSLAGCGDTCVGDGCSKHCAGYLDEEFEGRRGCITDQREWDYIQARKKQRDEFQARIIKDPFGLLDWFSN